MDSDRFLGYDEGHTPLYSDYIRPESNNHLEKYPHEVAMTDMKKLEIIL